MAGVPTSRWQESCHRCRSSGRHRSAQPKHGRRFSWCRSLRIVQQEAMCCQHRHRLCPRSNPCNWGLFNRGPCLEHTWHKGQRNLRAWCRLCACRVARRCHSHLFTRLPGHELRCIPHRCQLQWNRSQTPWLTAKTGQYLSNCRRQTSCRGSFRGCVLCANRYHSSLFTHSNSHRCRRH